MTTVDVVIPTFNRQARLVRTLEALSRQTFKDFGVIVVDDGSTPPVRAALQGREFPFPLRVIETGAAGGGPARARNLGVAKSHAELIAFVDDDVDPAPDWLERHLAHQAAATKLIVSFGPLLAPPDWKPTPWNWWEAETLAREYARMTSGLYQPGWRQVFTGNAMMPRTSILAAGGFNESFTRAEDIELALRLEQRGHGFVFAADAVGWHYSRRSLASWLRIPREYARFDVDLHRMYPGMKWLETIDEERGRRRRLMRVSRRVSGGLGRPVMRSLGVAAARALFVVGRRSAAVRGLSFVYDLEYGAALGEARR